MLEVTHVQTLHQDLMIPMHIHYNCRAHLHEKCPIYLGITTHMQYFQKCIVSYNQLIHCCLRSLFMLLLSYLQSVTILSIFLRLQSQTSCQ